MEAGGSCGGAGGGVGVRVIGVWWRLVGSVCVEGTVRCGCTVAVHGVHVDAMTSGLVDRASCVIIHGPVLVSWRLFGNSGVD